MEIKRYDLIPDGFGGVYESEDSAGGYVRFSDHEDAMSEKDRMHKESIAAIKEMDAELFESHEQDKAAALMRIYKFIVSHADKLSRDHACKECVPHSDMLVEGFVCIKHEALRAVLADEGKKCSTT